MTGKATPPIPGKFPLRVTLVVPFVLQILAAVGLVGYLSFRNGQRAVNDLATQLRSEVTARIEAELTTYLESPHNFNQLNASAFAEGNFDLATASNAKQFLTQIQISPFVYASYCGDAQGQALGVMRRPRQASEPIALFASNAQTDNRFYFYAMDDRGNRQRILEKLKAYDPRQRPWYKAALQQEKPIWTEVYLDFAIGLPTITASMPVYDASGKIAGVCATDVVLLQDLRQFLASLSIGRTGEAFVIDRAGSMLSSSTDEPLTVGQGEQAKLVTATASENPLVRETARYLQQQFDGFEQIQQSQQLNYQINGERQFVHVLPLKDGRGIDWLIVVVVPEADFMRQIYATLRNAIGLTLLALTTAIAVGIWTSRWVTKPIQRVSQASEEIAKGHLDQQIAPSPITEIDALATSFNSMAGQIQQSFQALQQSEATNRAIVTTIPDLMIRAKGDGTYLEIVGSDRLRGVHGVKQFSRGRTVRESLPPDLAELRMHHIRQALTTGELQVYEQRITIDAQPQDEEVRILVMGDDEVLIMVRDITDRKRAEEALRIAEENYRSIFENALEGIFQSSPGGQFINANSALAKIYGYDSPAEMMASITNIGEQLYVDPEKRAEFRKLLEQQDAVKDFQYRCYCKDGSIIWIQIDARAVKDNDGRVLYYEGIVQDITERKRREDELRRQLEELKIEIDQKKREKEVATLTESSYFQEVQQEMAEVNLDEFWS
ncbi:MAG: PAS domain S-box protein [Elainella sp. C42_A2020_010]|nr:PAS domain S-box protein [Elainella sp. C42_A2020_010]